MKRILLVGAYGGHNRGDELILRQILSAIDEVGYDATIASSNPLLTTQVHHRPSIESLDVRRRRFSVLQKIKNFDAVILGGGEQIQERPLLKSAYPFWGLLPNAAYYSLAAKHHKKILMSWSIGVDEVENPWGRLLVRRAVGNANALTVRDPASRDRLLQIGVPDARVTVSADPVFSLPRIRQTDLLEFKRNNMERLGDSPIVLFVPASDGRTDLAYLRPTIEGCKKVAQHLDGKVLVYLMDNQPRYDASLLSREEFAEDEWLQHFHSEDPDPYSAVLAIASSAIVISARMHPLIISATQDIPWLNISRSPKMEAFESFFNGQPLNVKSVTPEDIFLASIDRLENWERGSSAREAVLNGLRRLSETPLNILQAEIGRSQ